MLTVQLKGSVDRNQREERRGRGSSMNQDEMSRNKHQSIKLCKEHERYLLSMHLNFEHLRGRVWEDVSSRLPVFTDLDINLRQRRREEKQDQILMKYSPEEMPRIEQAVSISFVHISSARDWTSSNPLNIFVDDERRVYYTDCGML